MYRKLALVLAACAWALPAAAVNITVEFEAVVDGFTSAIPAIPFIKAAPPPSPGASTDAALPVPGPVIPGDPVGPSLGDVVAGTVLFEIDKGDAVRNVSGAAPIAGADPRLVAATVSAVDRVEACTDAEPCVFAGPVPKFMIPIERTTARGTLTAEYEPNVTFTSPTFDSAVEWLDLAILIGAPLNGGPAPASFFELLRLPGALPLEVDYMRVERGMASFPGVDPDDCGFFTCTTVSATVISGAIRIDGGPTPIPVPASLAALLAWLGALALLRLSARG
jgi:hypothetical protein